MTLQENLIELSPYNIDFRYYGNWYLIGVQYKEGWQILEPDNPLIEHMPKDGKYYYSAPMNEVSIDEIFNSIKDTIEHNKDLQKKVELFQQKIEELQNIFSVEDYDTLLTLNFKYKKYKKKKPKDKVNEDVISEEKHKSDETVLLNDDIDEVQFVDTMNEEEVFENKFLEPMN